MVRSCGADASMVASWMGWIKTLASILVVSLAGIVSSAGAMVSDGFRRLKMEWEAWCVWSQGVRGSPLQMHDCEALLAFLAISLGFARCFCKPSSISQVNFAIWRPFRSPKVISQSKGSFAAQRWWKEGKKSNRFATAKHLAKWGFGCGIRSFYASQPFRSCKTPCEMGLWLWNWKFLCFAAISQLRNEGHCAAKWHSCAKKWFRSCEILCEMELFLRK